LKAVFAASAKQFEEVAMKAIPLFLSLVLTVALGVAADQDKPQKTPVKVNRIDESGRTTSIDPDKVVIEIRPGKPETLRELLSKFHRVGLRNVSIIYHDADTKAIIKNPIFGPVQGRDLSSPPSYYDTEFPRDFQIISREGGFEVYWVGLEETSLPVGAKGYKSKQVLIDKKVLDKGVLEVFLKKEEPVKRPARDR
jgi:hypothetical protein